jgi:hypothetical protein
VISIRMTAYIISVALASGLASMTIPITSRSAERYNDRSETLSSLQTS